MKTFFLPDNGWYFVLKPVTSLFNDCTIKSIQPSCFPYHHCHQKVNRVVSTNLCRTIWIDIWSKKRREIITHKIIRANQKTKSFVYRWLVMRTCTGWCNMLSCICRIIKRHLKRSVDMLILLLLLLQSLVLLLSSNDVIVLHCSLLALICLAQR